MENIEQSDVQVVNNVIEFPNKHQHRRSGDIHNVEEFIARSDDLTKLFAEEAIMEIFEDTMLKLSQVDGFDHEVYPQDIGMLFEAIKSMRYRMLGYEHPLQEIADDLYEDYQYGAFEIEEDDY